MVIRLESLSVCIFKIIYKRKYRLVSHGVDAVRRSIQSTYRLWNVRHSTMNIVEIIKASKSKWSDHIVSVAGLRFVVLWICPNIAHTSIEGQIFNVLLVSALFLFHSFGVLSFHQYCFPHQTKWCLLAFIYTVIGINALQCRSKHNQIMLHTIMMDKENESSS